MNLKQAVREAWEQYKSLPYNTSQCVAVLWDCQNDTFSTASYSDYSAYTPGYDQVLVLPSLRWYDGAKRPEYTLLRDAQAEAENNLEGLKHYIQCLKDLEGI